MNKHSIDIRSLIEKEKNMTEEDKQKKEVELQSRSDAALSGLMNFIENQKKEAEKKAADEAVQIAADEAKENERKAKLEKLKASKGK